jgi:uncharacterized membrane protein YdjX (TVP38/TMEM64 family)
MTESLPRESALAEARARRALRVLRVAVLAPFVAAVAAYLLAPGWREAVDTGLGHLARGEFRELEAWARGFGWGAPLATLALMVAQALVAPIPAILVTWTNSLLFGPFLGGLWSIASGTLAAAVCFALARAFGAPLARRLVAERALARTNAFVELHGGTAVFVARLLPVVPFDPVSYVAGFTRLRWRTFLLATFVGQLPAGMAYSYLGQELARPGRLVLLGATTFLALLVVGLAVRRALLGPRTGP